MKFIGSYVDMMIEMIIVTRLNQSKLVINADLIKFVEETPDTIVTLQGGDKLVVRESADEIIKATINYVRMTRSPMTALG